MINHLEVQLALRARLLALSVCTTGSTALGASAAGYTRAAGSFITDGFAVGMQVTPAGFTQAARGVITQLTDTLMTIKGGRTVDAASAGRTIAALLPNPMGWNNVRLEPVTDEPYGEEDYQPGTSALLGMATGGSRDDAGIYVLRFYGPDEIGVSALYALAGAVLALYPCGPGPVLASGKQLYIRDQPAPAAGPVRSDKPGWSVIMLSIFWRLYSSNS